MAKTFCSKESPEWTEMFFEFKAYWLASGCFQPLTKKTKSITQE